MKSRKDILILVMVAAQCCVLAACHAQLSSKLKEKIVSNIGDSLRAYYVFPDTGAKMGEFIMQKFKNHGYDTTSSAQAFAAQLTIDLHSVYRDLHMTVGYNDSTKNEADQTSSVQQRAEDQKQRLRKELNLGFTKTEIMPNNIGYIEVAIFVSPDDEAKEKVKQVLNQVSHCDYLIVDLRKCMGGSPRMIAYICGFLFRDTTHLNDLYSTYNNSLIRVVTTPDSSFRKLNTVPIYILTSSKTYSGGEEFSYDLQSLKRAVIVGETTGGAAHPIGPWALGDGFFINIPFGRAINPITKTDWEGTGVIPDVTAPADQSLEMALAKIGTDRQKE